MRLMVTTAKRDERGGVVEESKGLWLLNTMKVGRYGANAGDRQSLTWLLGAAKRMPSGIFSPHPDS